MDWPKKFQVFTFVVWTSYMYIVCFVAMVYWLKVSYNPMINYWSLLVFFPDEASTSQSPQWWLFQVCNTLCISCRRLDLIVNLSYSLPHYKIHKITINLFVICKFTFNDVHVSEPLFLSYISNIFTMFVTVIVHAPLIPYDYSCRSNFLVRYNFQHW